MRYWVVVVAAGAGTYLLRASLIVLLARVQVPPLLTRAFRYVAPAVLAALTVPAFLAPSGPLELSPPRVLAGAAAAAVAWRFHSIPAALVAGFGAYWLVTALG